MLTFGGNLEPPPLRQHPARGTTPEGAVAVAARRAGDALASDGYRGYDPYDALESPLFRLPGLRSAKVPRWGAQQVLKRMPVNVRPLLRIRKGYNPVTLALALQGLAYLVARDPGGGAELRRRAGHCVSELERLASPGWSGCCWGYDFDWEARYARIPAGTPTVVATGFVTNALFTAHTLMGSDSAADMCLSAARFLVEDVPRLEEPDGTFCWMYSPFGKDVVLNATMKGARLCAQGHALGGGEDLLEPARRTASFVAQRQDERGRWPYSVSDTRHWADNFHTAYVLDCFASYQELTGDARFADTLRKGFAYYRANFFTGDLVPRYYDNETYPIDATSCAQSILTLCNFGDADAAARAGAWVVANMQRPDGHFAYQIHRRYTNRIPYARWSTAWLFCALARLTLERPSA
jgi:hypothetical protein